MVATQIFLEVSLENWGFQVRLLLFFCFSSFFWLSKYVLDIFIPENFGEIHGIQFLTTAHELFWSPPCRFFQILKGQDSFPLPCPREKNPPFLGASKLFVSFREGRVKIWKIKAPKFPAISYAKSNVGFREGILRTNFLRLNFGSFN